MEGVTEVITTSMSSRESLKIPKSSDQHAAPHPLPILNYFLQQMLSARLSLYRSFFRETLLTRHLKSTLPSTVTTRNKSYTYDDAPQEQAKLEATVESLDGQRARWVSLLRLKHYEPVISEVLSQELPKYKNRTTVNATKSVQYIRECARILASEPPILMSAVEGDFVRRIRTDSDLKQEYDLICKNAEQQLSIYIHQFADRDGIPPTPNQLLTIRDYIADYISDNLSEGKASEDASQIDRVLSGRPLVDKETLARVHRKYLCTEHCSRSKKRVGTLEQFCQGAQKRRHETPASLRDTPIRYPLGECGYAENSHKRLKQHRERQSSNYVTNLVEDVCTHLHNIGIFEQRFTMHQYIVYLIDRREQVEIAEIFCSALLQVWVSSGGGFNSYPAGLSVNSAKKVSSVDWASYEMNTTLHSPITENMRMQQLRADEWQQALRWTGENAVDSETRESASQAEDCM